MTGIRGSVYKTYESATYFIPYLLSIAFCALPYAQSFCEDLKHKYINQILIRVKLKKYVFSRILFICLCSAITMIVGTMIFIILIRMQVPWVQTDDLQRMDELGEMLENHYIIYYFVRSFFTGILAACLAILGSYLSLYWQSSFLIISTPFLFLYTAIFVANSFFPDIAQTNIILCFNPIFNVWSNMQKSLLYPVVIALIFLFILAVIIYKKIGSILWSK